MYSYLPVFLLTLVASQAISADVTHQGETMGTTFMVRIIDEQTEDATQEWIAAVDERLIKINQLMSTYDPDSELSRFNSNQQTDWFSASSETVAVVQRALEISELSGGAFDPTVSRLVRMWSFGPDHQIKNVPSDEDIESALKSVGYQHISVREKPPALKKDLPEVELDLSAIAKGYAVDSISELLLERDYQNFMVEIGGEVRVQGQVEQRDWRLGIEQPDELNLNRELQATVSLNNESLATSGDYRNYFEQDGIKYSHTISPFSGKPVTHQLASVSVIAADCMTADALATTFMVLGPEQGMELADQQGITTYFITRDGDHYRATSSRMTDDRFTYLQATEADQNSNTNSAGSLLTTFLITLTVFGIAIIGLAAGTLLANKDLKGSCGGIEGTKDENGKSVCELCTTPPEECDRLKEEIAKGLKVEANTAGTD